MSAFFAWTVLPTGGLVTAMLASGNGIAMMVASKVLSTPVRMGSLQISIAVLMTAFAGLTVWLSYGQMQRAEARLVATVDAVQAPGVRDQQERDYFHAGRNYYMGLLGLALWSLAWRLKVLHDQTALRPFQAKPPQRANILSRVVNFAVGAALVLSADIPLCRLTYTVTLASNVTPDKLRLLRNVGPCQAAMEGSATGICAELCAKARGLSEERLATIVWARKYHRFGRIAAELFDDTRGVRQGHDRIQRLFDRKTCVQVLESVDKSNPLVNWICFTAAMVAVVGAFIAFSNAWEGTWSGNAAGGAVPEQTPRQQAGKQD